MNQPTATLQRMKRFRTAAAVVGAVCALVAVVAAFFQPAAFFRVYLAAFLLPLGVALGSLSLLLVHHLVGGNWGHVVRGPFEAAARTLPLVAVMAVPILAGAFLGWHDLYPWATSHAAVDTGHASHAQEVYLGKSFFTARAVAYFALWIGLAAVLCRGARRGAQSATSPWPTRLRAIAGPGLIVYGFTVTFATIDWVMTRDPHWHSTIYGAIFAFGNALSALAVATVVVCGCERAEPFRGTVQPTHRHDLGNLLFALVLLWSYVTFSQYLIIWSGNLPHEVPWYLRRTEGPWLVLAIALVVFHFAVPFLLLLFRTVKRDARALGIVAVALVAVRHVDALWLVGPGDAGGGLHWLDLVVPPAVVGLWLAAFLGSLRSWLPVIEEHLNNLSPVTAGEAH